MKQARRRAAELAERAAGLALLEGVTSVAPGSELLQLALAVGRKDRIGARAAYGALFRSLLGAGQGLRAALAAAVRYDENLLATSDAPEALAAASEDLRTLQQLAEWAEALPAGEEGWPALPADGAADGEAAKPALGSDGWAAALAAAPDWGALAPALAAAYRAGGAGPLARFRAFRWSGAGLTPVVQPDVPSPEALIGYEEERALLRRNTAQFVAGYPANSVLLYGDRGTGKSSSVKSLLHPDSAAGGHMEHWERLRLVEVPKARLGDFPAIVQRLRDRPQRFILFVDDLSFEDGETDYKDMKALLEGGIEARPANVVLYATSNRRHLIREQFTDRAGPDSNDVHARDTVEEKLSFSDRFGMTITFPSPSQSAYLAIVEGLATQRGLHLEPALLRAKAIEWAAWHNGRSGRTARQFVDFLEGEVGLGAASAVGVDGAIGG